MVEEKKRTKLFIVAGEASGDMHGADLARCLRKLEPDVELHGFGGPKMAEAGVRVHEDLMALAFMWFKKVFANLHTIFALLRKGLDLIDEIRPDAVVLIDYPGFNLSLARFLRKRRITVLYYMAPQLWAWGGWRIRKVKKRVSHALVALPFEEEYFNSRGLPATYVGHPLFDHLRAIEPFEDVRGPVGAGPGDKLLALLPGSRRQEIERMLPVMLEGLKLLKRRVKDVRAAVASPNEEYAQLVRAIAAVHRAKVVVLPGRAHDLINSADACLTASGTTSLEIMYLGKPMVVIYRVNQVSYSIARLFSRSKFISLVNIIAGREIVPERLMSYDDIVWLADHLETLLVDEKARAKVIADLRDLARRIDEPGATERAAREVLRLAREKPLPPKTRPKRPR